MRPAHAGPKAVGSGDEKLTHGNDLPGRGRATPAEAGECAAVAFEVLKADVIFLAGDQVDGAGPFGGSLRRPVIDDQAAIDPEAHAVVGAGVEGVALGFLRLNFSGPAGGEGVSA